MRINHNLAAINTHRQMSTNGANSAKNMEKLSSGLRINRAGDDAAGLAISEKMRGQIRGLEMASKNAQDGISMIQTVEGSMNETHSILQRMRELAVQATNDTNVTKDRLAIKDELVELHKEIKRIADTTEFNTQKLIKSGVQNVVIQIGANSGQNIAINFANMQATGTNINIGSADLTISAGTATANALIQKTNDAIIKVSTERSKLGAIQNRLEHTINNLDNAAENLTSAESRVRDVDMAKEMMQFTKNNILSQAAQAMLAQANQQPQGVLQLLR